MSSEYKVQSVLFSREHFNKKQAETWLVENGYQVKKLDISKNYLRYRQLDPSYMQKLGLTEYHNKKLGNGHIELVIGYKKKT